MSQRKRAPHQKQKRRKRDERLVSPAPAALSTLAFEELPDHQTARPLRQQAVLQAQQLQGNQAARQLLGQARGPGQAAPGLVQLHPEGAGLSVDPSAVAEEVTAPPRINTAVPVRAGRNKGRSARARPKPATREAMSLGQAENVLQAAYGGVHKIVPGSIVLLDGRAAVWAKYDEVCINLGCVNDEATPPRPWQNGDAQAFVPGLEGFADNGIVYVNKKSPLVTVTAHEMLHNNTAGDFRGAVGETINEGSTEYLAIKALNKAGIPTPGGATAYPTEVGIVTKLIDLVGEKALISAYFGGAKLLIDAYNLLAGFDGFEFLKLAAEPKLTSVTDILLRRPSTQQKIDLINELLNGWVSDKDLGKIEMVVNSASSGERVAIVKAVQRRIRQLISPRQRKRLAGMVRMV